jgi:hypothetical protein
MKNKSPQFNTIDADKDNIKIEEKKFFKVIEYNDKQRGSRNNLHTSYLNRQKESK